MCRQRNQQHQRDNGTRNSHDRGPRILGDATPTPVV
jgi:hypothetical protein